MMLGCPVGVHRDNTSESEDSQIYRKCSITIQSFGKCGKCGRENKLGEQVNCHFGWVVCTQCYPKHCELVKMDDIDFDSLLMSNNTKKLLEEKDKTDLPFVETVGDSLPDPEALDIPANPFQCPHCGCWEDGFVERGYCSFITSYNNEGSSKETEHDNYDSDETECGQCGSSINIDWNASKKNILAYARAMKKICEAEDYFLRNEFVVLLDEAGVELDK